MKQLFIWFPVWGHITSCIVLISHEHYATAWFAGVSAYFAVWFVKATEKGDS